MKRFLGLLLLAAMGVATARAQRLPESWALADAGLRAYFEDEVRRIESACLADVRTAADWERQRGTRRRELLGMLGLWPLPPRTDLRAAVTGRVAGDGYHVENVTFQSMPGLHVTANLYLPDGATNRVPAILYVCGHAEVKRDGVSLGNKVHYRHHGAWLARHGYACLVVDTLQLGEIQGDHHGTYRLGQWWWNARGYTPAGVEAWNSMRALDYLETRPEVDAARFGMTGRSGGGSYTWVTAAIDERVRCAAPVAGIADLRNHVCDGSVEGHCDCMFFVNTARWDFPMVAALVSPRPLLVVNTDADTLFPLDGVERLFAKARRVYALQGADADLGLVVAPGPHEDTQDLQVPVLRWFDRHLMKRARLVREAAEPPDGELPLKVLGSVPPGQRNTTIQRDFNERPAREPASPGALRDALRATAFAGWPADPGPLGARTTRLASAGTLRLSAVDFSSQAHVPLRLFLLEDTRGTARSARLEILDDAGWRRVGASLARRFPGVPGLPPASGDAPDAAADVTRGTAVAWLAPRGIGPAAWTGEARKQVQIRRRFQLVGQTADGMRVWDVRRGLGALRAARPSAKAITLAGRGGMAVHALLAAAFEDTPLALDPAGMPASFLEGPDFLGIANVATPARVLALVGSGGTVAVAPDGAAR